MSKSDMTNKAKWITILVCFVFLILAAGAGMWNRQAPGGRIESAEDLKGARLGGVAGRMPAGSAKIFFESMIGRKLRSYTDFGSMDESLCALKNGSVDAIWATSVTADYLLASDEKLGLLDTSDMAAIENTEEPRFAFGMAAVNDIGGKELIAQIDYALDFLEGDGVLDELYSKYVDGALTAEKYSEKNMVVNDSIHKVYYYSTDPLTVGVTGAVPPLELIDANGHPYGYCVALMDEVGQVLQRGVRFVVLDNETAFSSLMSGRVDLIFCYGSGKITTESAQSWYMSRGYCDMQKYEFVYRKD